MVECASRRVRHLYVGSDERVYKGSQQTAASIAAKLLHRLDGVCGVAVDGAGNVLAADGPHVVLLPAKSGTFYG